MNSQKIREKNKKFFLTLAILFVLSIFITISLPTVALATDTNFDKTSTNATGGGAIVPTSQAGTTPDTNASNSAGAPATGDPNQSPASTDTNASNEGSDQKAADSGDKPNVCPDDVKGIGLLDLFKGDVFLQVACKFIDIFLGPPRIIVNHFLTTERMSKSLSIPRDAASGTFVIDMWSAIRDIINVIFMLAFMMMALLNVLNTLGIGSALGGKLDSWQVKKMIPAMIGAVVLVNFSLSICNLFVDFSNFLVSIFIPSAATGNIAEDVGLGSIFSDGENSGFAAFMEIDKITIGAAVVKVIAIWAFTIILFYLWLIMWVRGIIIKLLFIFSATPYIANVVPVKQITELVGKWWGEFIKWVLMGPIVALFLFITAKAISFTGEITAGNELGDIGVGDGIATTGDYDLTQLILAIVIIYVGITTTLKMSKDAGKIVDKGIEKATFGKVKGIGDAWNQTGGKKIEQAKESLGAGVKKGFYKVAASDNLIGRGIKGAMDRNKIAQLKVDRKKSEAEDARKVFDTKQSENDRIRALKIGSASAIEEKALARYQNMSTENAIKALESDLTPPDQKAIILKALTLQAREKYDDPTKGISSKDALDYVTNLTGTNGKNMDAFSEINSAEVLNLMKSEQIGGKLMGVDPATGKSIRKKVPRNDPSKALENIIDMADDAKLKAAESALNSIDPASLDPSQQANVQSRLKEAARQIIDEAGFNVASDEDALQLLDDIKHNRATRVTDTSGNAIDLNSLTAEKTKALSNAKQGVYSALDGIQKANEAVQIRSSVQRISNMMNDPALLASFGGDTEALIMNYQSNLDSAINAGLSVEDTYNFAKNYYPDLTVGKTAAEANAAIVARMKSDRDISELAVGQYTRDGKFGPSGNNQKAWFERMSKNKKN